MTDIPTPPRGRAMPRRRLATPRAISALVLREMATTHGRSPGGYIWAVLEPAAGIALLAMVFSAVVRSPPVGISFAMFYATGMVPFLLFNEVHGKIATCLMFSKQLLAYPTVTFVDAILARFILNTMTQLLVGYVIFTGCLMMFETRVTLDLPAIVLGFVMAAGLALGIGTLNAYAFTRFNVMQRLWSIIMRPMFLISGVIFPLYLIPQPYQDWLWWNPLVHVVGQMRGGFYPTYDASYVSVIYVMGISGGCLAMGLLLLRRNYQDLLSQ